jgi:hypothetical protein
MLVSFGCWPKTGEQEKQSFISKEIVAENGEEKLKKKK